MGHALQVEWLGSIRYAEALELQLEAVEARRRGGTPDRLLLLEHPPVVTLGRSAKPANLLATPEALAARGVDLHEVARGGDVTYHGAGQLVGYLVADLDARGERDVHAWLRGIEGALIDALSDTGIRAGRIDGMTGVFVAGSAPPRKLASIGVGLKGWVSYHGFALNVTMELAEFSDIVPCGLHGVVMSSVAAETGRARDAALFDAVRETVADHFVRRLS